MSGDPVLDLAMARLKKAIGTPRHLKAPMVVVLFALASMTGNLERITLRPAASSMDFIKEGYEAVQPEWVTAFWKGRVPDSSRDLQANHKPVAKVIKRIQKQMAKTGVRPISSNVWLTALAHVAGQVSRYLNMELAAVELLLRTAWERTTDEQVEEFQRLAHSIGSA